MVTDKPWNGSQGIGGTCVTGRRLSSGDEAIKSVREFRRSLLVTPQVRERRRWLGEAFIQQWIDQCLAMLTMMMLLLLHHLAANQVVVLFHGRTSARGMWKSHHQITFFLLKVVSLHM